MNWKFAGRLDDDIDSGFQIVVVVRQNQLRLTAAESRGKIAGIFVDPSSKLSLNRSRQMRFNLTIVR